METPIFCIFYHFFIQISILYTNHIQTYIYFTHKFAIYADLIMRRMTNGEKEGL